MSSADWDVEAFLKEAVDTAPDPGHSLHTDSHWATVEPHGAPLPEHGWKLHISSRADNLPELLDALVPALLDARCHFKVARSLPVLVRLNHGQDSPAAVGKAVTVYPEPSRARELGLALAELLRGHEGPRVLSDRRIRADSPVYYRYGPFSARWYAGDKGALALRIPGPDGAFFDAAATLDYRQPSWVTDPFAAADSPHGAGADGPGDVLGGRYRVTRGIYQAAHGNVFRAVETASGREVVVKQARAHVGEGRGGSDARTRLRNERRVLEAARGIEGLPEFLDHFAHGDDEFLVTSDAGSTNLLVHVRLHGAFLHPAHTAYGAPPAGFLRMMTELAGTLCALHDRGVVMRDLTPRNIVLGEKRAVLIDLALAALDGLHLPGGTAGFAPARQLADEPPRAEDDCYALGMALGYAATGMLPLTGTAVPGLARTRMLQSLGALYGATQRDFVRLLGALTDDRPAAAREALRALAAGEWFGTQAASAAPAGHAPVGGAEPETEPEQLAGHALGTLLGAVDRYLLDAPATAIGGVDASVYTGSAGVGLELLHHQDHPDVPRAVTRLAAHTAAASRRVGLAPGLYAGTTGIRIFRALALRAGYAAEPPREDVPPEPTDDMLSGMAGVGLGHLLLYDTEGGAAHLDLAREHAARMLSRSEPLMAVTPDSGLPHGAGVDPSFGYAHGLAGVVDFLVALAARDQDPAVARGALARAHELRRRAADLVAASAAPSAVPITASWCQGLAGAARALHHAGTLFDEPALRAAALSAAHACADWVPRMENLSQCCGVSGVGSALVELARDSGDERCWEGAGRAARQLLTRSAGPDEAPSFIDLDGQDAPLSWGMGVAGALAFLRRLAQPAQRDLLPPVLPG
ncbi:lanthionine synthetase LanC family protein [Streptomyces boncukensis]|uniref:Protein kinase domain-containing protein n=1 Tax=Streptomyces boncukensis TaxID=2711219 RepID=A0A6G4X0E9_9ACTN|nr:lanthionine synthetase LanC family protein [Streptomyces boncukensis]NGO70965.1 hypothetical protein [Streptomyces boncukensis]